MDTDALEQAKAEQRKIIDEWLDSIPDADKRERLRAFNWNMQQRIDQLEDPVAQMNEMITIFWEHTKKFEDACNGIFPEPKDDNVVAFSPVDPNDNK